LAQERDIPFLGICRGLQTIGYHEGLAVTDLPNDANKGYPHYDEPYGDYNRKVVIKSGSQLHNALQQELGEFGQIEFVLPVSIINI
jgi:gamma-glutamyl-gamma-aminobutyrate hydrolase PuuD